MGRKITMRGKNAQYIERRAADATPDNERKTILLTMRLTLVSWLAPLIFPLLSVKLLPVYARLFN